MSDSAEKVEELEPGHTEMVSIGGLEIPFHWCPAGKYLMGSPETEVGRFSDEEQREVTIEEGFFMCEFPCTQAMWSLVMGNNPSEYKGFDRATHPVTNVSWDDAQEFVARLNKINPDWEFSLPTEAEWEYAARAGTQTPYVFGETLDESQANFNSNQTTPVGSYPPNNWGLVDVHGNVWEWCESSD